MSLSTDDARADGSSSSATFFDSMTSAFSSFFPTAKADEGDDDEGGDEEGGDDKEEGGEDSEGGEEEGGDEEEEEEDEPEDVSVARGSEAECRWEGVLTPSFPVPEQPMPAVYEQCENSKECSPAKHHFLECQERVQEGKGFKDENCVEEL